MIRKVFAGLLAVAVLAAYAPAQDDKPKFFLENGKVVERLDKSEAELKELRTEVAALKTELDKLKGIRTVAESGPGELGGRPVTVPLKPVACYAPGEVPPLGCPCTAESCTPAVPGLPAQPCGCTATNCTCLRAPVSKRPGEIPYKEAWERVARGEAVTIFFGCPPELPLYGLWTVSDVVPAHGPGAYLAFRDANGKAVINKITATALPTRPAPQPVVRFTLGSS
jgi:hypothetical protein